MNAVRQTPATLSEPPRELKIALGYGLTLALSFWPASDRFRDAYIHVGLYSSTAKLGRYKSSRLASSVISTAHVASSAHIDSDELVINGTSFDLDTERNAEAITHWFAAHGLTLRQEEN